MFPSLHLHAVIDLEGFSRLGEFVGDLIAGLQWSPFDWAVIDSSFEEDVALVVDGLRRFAENSGTAVGPRAEALFDGQRNPWVRLAEG